MEINKDDAMTELLELAIAELKKLPDAHQKDLPYLF